ncbi:putative nucleotidyltransferase [Thioalkalivibrio sp. ALE21]|nr:putative nucleotidyltransferase [Thioalkalivibrio sp. ALE21]
MCPDQPTLRLEGGTGWPTINGMRLRPEHIKAIREVVRRECGASARVRLFGSRLDDAGRGGDVDVLVELDDPVERPAMLSARLSAMISRRLQGRAVDVVLSAPNITRSPVHDIAEREGQLL